MVLNLVAQFPGLAMDVDLADEALGGYGFFLQVPETEAFKGSIRSFVSTSIAPHVASSYPEVMTSSTSMAALEDSAILTDISSQAAIHGEEEALAGFRNIVRSDEPYFLWTMASSHPLPSPSFGDYNYPHFDLSTFTSGSLSPVLDTVGPSPQWAPSSSTAERKAILVEPDPEPHQFQNLSLLQQEYLDKLSKPPSVEGTTSLVVPSGKAPPGHSSRSLFKPHRHAQGPRLGAISKRRPLIYKWATSLAPQIKRISTAGSQGPERPGSFDSPATLSVDPRSPNSKFLDHHAAEVHKIAERKRRSNMNNKLRTLISLVPIIDKKDKVSVLTSTIDYIRDLEARISSHENREDAGAASTSGREEMESAEEHGLLRNVSTAGDRLGPVVTVESSSDDQTWLIKVRANCHSRSLIQLLNLFQELDLKVVSVDYGTVDEQFRTSICIKQSRNLSSSQLKETLCRVLEAGDRSPSGSN